MILPTVCQFWVKDAPVRALICQVYLDENDYVGFIDLRYQDGERIRLRLFPPKPARQMATGRAKLQIVPTVLHVRPDGNLGRMLAGTLAEMVDQKQLFAVRDDALGRAVWDALHEDCPEFEAILALTDPG